MTYEGFRTTLLSYNRKMFAKSRHKKLTNTNFTIISNNCWGGVIYESYDLPKNTPTAGMFFMADDYIEFVSDLKGNTSRAVEFIKPEDSKYVEQLSKDDRFGSYPIGKIGDSEICFLHNHSQEEAADKWERRCKRINWDKLIVKFNDQNGCEVCHVKAFSELDFDHKLFFTIKDWPVTKWDGYYKIKQGTKEDFVTFSHEPFVGNKYFDLTAYLNNL